MGRTLADGSCFTHIKLLKHLVSGFEDSFSSALSISRGEGNEFVTSWTRCWVLTRNICMGKTTTLSQRRSHSGEGAGRPTGGEGERGIITHASFISHVLMHAQLGAGAATTNRRLRPARAMPLMPLPRLKGPVCPPGSKRKRSQFN